MSCINELERSVIRYLGDHCGELSGELNLGLYKVQLGNGLDCHLDSRQLLAKLLGQFEKYPSDLTLFLAFKILQLVVRLDRLERFDEDRLAARREAMGDAADLPTEIRFHGDHE